MSSSLADLKEFAKESRTLAKTISPLESQIANIKSLVAEGIGKNDNKVSEVISLIKENLTYSQTSLKPLSQSANEKLDSMLSSLPNALTESEGKVTQTIENGVSSIKEIYAERMENIQERIENVSQKLQNVEEKFVELDQKTGDLEKQINKVQANLAIIAQQNEAQLNTLKESVEKIQATLDIVVNLTTPFWKKWGK